MRCSVKLNGFINVSYKYMCRNIYYSIFFMFWEIILLWIVQDQDIHMVHKLTRVIHPAIIRYFKVIQSPPKSSQQCCLAISFLVLT